MNWKGAEQEAKNHIVRGDEQIRRGDFDDTFTNYDAEIEIYARVQLQDTPEMDDDRAKIKVSQANTHRALGNIEAALADYDLAIEFYEQPHLRDRSELDEDRARLQMIRANTLDYLGRRDLALWGYDAAIEINERPHLLDRSELDEDRANLQMNRSITLDDLGEPDEALAGYDAAIEIHERPHLRDRPDLDTFRANLQMNRAITLRQLGHLEAALAGHKAAIEIHERPHLRNRPELDVFLANLQMNQAIALNDLGELKASLSGYDAAIEIGKRPHMRDRHDFDAFRANLQMNRAITLDDMGDLKAALTGYDAAIKIHERPHLRDRSELDEYRARLQMNRANTLRALGQLDAALTGYKDAIAIHKRFHLRNRPELDATRADLQMNRAITLNQLGELKESLTAYEDAIEIYSRAHLQDRPELDEDRSRLQMNRAITLDDLGDIEAAIAGHDAAIKIHERSHLRDRPELDEDRVRLQMNRANTLYALGNPAGSLRGYDTALEILARPHLKNRSDLDLHRAALFAAKSRLIGGLSSALRREFVDDASAFLVDRLELAPLPQAGQLYDPFAGYREDFLFFHSTWLRIAISCGWHDDIVRILATIQGRDMAARMLDELEGTGLFGSSVPSIVKAYHQTRMELRKLRARIEDIVTGGRASTVSGDDGHRALLDLSSRTLNSVSASRDLKVLRERYDTLHGELQLKREAAAKEKGYSLLSRPYQQLTLQKIQTILKPGNQAMLILLDMGDKEVVLESRFHALIVRHDQTHLVALPELHRAAKKMSEYPDAQRHQPNRALHAQRQEAASRGYRDGPTPDRGVSFGEVTPMFVDDDYRYFWEDDGHDGVSNEASLADLHKRYLWEPLADALVGVEHIISSSQGQLHSLPLQCGLPKRLTLRNYPGLVFYAGRHGLLGGNTGLNVNKADSIRKEAIGVYAYAGQNKDIPNTLKEIEWVWRLHQDKRPMQSYPLDQKHPPYVHCLHMACHGTADNDRAGQVKLIIGDQEQDKQTLDMSDILDLPINADIVYLGCCLAGQTVEDMEGEPTGLVSGFFLRGTKVLIGSVVLINDAWGAVFGVMFEYHYRQKKDAHAALALAKADIASGDWDPARFGEDALNHIESLRSDLDDAATQAPVPPQPILGDLLYGFRIFGE